ncbi:MAG: CoA ester lyase [Myxococcota bacterium]
MSAPTLRPRRSVLYMPGSNGRALEKGKGLDADGLILDLEDAVAPDAKAAARSQVMEAVRAGGYGHRELFVRANALDTPWGHEDLVAAATSGAHAVILPKVESADAVRAAVRVLEAAGAREDLALWVMMETPRGILRAEEIADAHRRLAGFVMGTSDLAKDLHAAHTAHRLPLLVGLGTALLAARAAGLSILDGVYLDLGDTEGFEASCRQGVELGFDGKTLIHPKQLAAANAAFAPTEAQLARARKVVDAFDEAQRQGKGVVLVDGRLVESLHVVAAQRTLALHRAITTR